MRAIAILVLIFSCLPSWAQPGPSEVAAATGDGGVFPVGGQFQINSYTTERQGSPAVDVAADGDFVVVWESLGSSGSDDGFSSVQGQRFASDGTRVGGEFQVNSYTPYDQRQPDVAMAADGAFVVVWESLVPSGSTVFRSRVRVRRYASDGTAVATEFQAHSETLSRLTQPVVATASDGDFVVVWLSTDESGRDIQSQRFASDGTALGGKFQVNSYTVSMETYPSASGLGPAVAVAPGGDFVVVWPGRNSNGSDFDFGVQGQRFASDGTALGGQFQVDANNTSITSFAPAVAVASNGNFVVVWNSTLFISDSQVYTSIQGQRFASDGTAAGDEFQVNTYTSELPFYPAVAAASDGGFVVVWDSTRVTSGPSVQGRRFASDGTAVGGQFQANSYISYRGRAAVASTPGGDFVAVWQSDGSSGSDTSDHSIQGQRYWTACTTRNRLCLKSDRFAVEVDWRDFNGNSGKGRLVTASEDSGVFYFFSPDNWEILVKVLDGCAITNHFWVFAAATTNVEHTLRVTDLETGLSKEYSNPLGTVAAATTDTAALPCLARGLINPQGLHPSDPG